MDSGVPLAPSFTASYPMMPTHFMGMNPHVSYNGMKNFSTQFAPWVSSQSPVNMPSPLQSSSWSTYMNPNIGSEGTIAPMPTSSLDMSHVPQPSFTMRGWNLPSYGSSSGYVLSGANTKMGAYSTYYTLSVYPLSAMSVPLNTFSMESPHVSSGVSYRENQFYGLGYPLHETPSQGGNMHPHSNNPYHDFLSFPTSTSVSMPLQTFMNQYGGGYYPAG
jgi:hypothetical protein